MTDIATLRTDVRSWLTRSDLTNGQIATATRLLEAELARDFRPRSIEKTVTLTVNVERFDLRTAGTGGTDLRVQKIRSLTNDDDTLGDNGLTELTPNQIEALDFNRIADPVGYYALVGDFLVLAPAPTATSPSTLTMDYFERPVALDDTNATHAQIQDFYDLYFFGVLKHLTQLLQDSARTQQFSGQFDRALRMAQKSENRARWANNPQTAFREVIEVP